MTRPIALVQILCTMKMRVNYAGLVLCLTLSDCFHIAASAYQMSMWDSMHTIDLGTIVTLIRAILSAFFECVEKNLDIEGRAPAKLEARFSNHLRNILASRT